MQLTIPDDQFELLTQRAVAEGYADVSAFIFALASAPLATPLDSLEPTGDSLRALVDRFPAPASWHDEV